ncbi:ammonium transporter [Sorangium cellulosum]|uniref:Ammonium transporter n=1 Tax=Sorangium cellulosum TaxID=56 RepID=A0A4P2PYD8_SORCE|nr:ammonium transporter [Sorangium cellulosum]AUX21598.1 ammonium transporter [Sorangium cellulosum]
MNEINASDTTWLLVSSALVLLMTPALALFYGGMVRTKNTLSTFMHSFFAMGLVTLAWVTLGYSMAFAETRGGLIGGLDHAFLNGVGTDPRSGTTVPHILFMAFQMMFAIITPALISGAYAERIKFSSYVVFTLLWSLAVYSPVCHWVWGPGGWLGARGALDFAGGTVVHLASGASALVVAILVGKRKGYPARKIVPHNLTMTLLGAGLLWFGWFGFNAGSALSANGLAAVAFVNTHIAAALGALAWALIEAVRYGKPSLLGVASGLVAGLVAITPAAGFVGPMGAMVIGLAAGAVCYGAVMLKGKLGYDDSLDAFGIHGVGGLLGALLTGVFASKVWNPAGQDGLLAGNTALFVEQVIAAVAAAAYAGVVTFVLVKGIGAVIGFRVDEEVEDEGLDGALHGEEAYSLGEGGAHAPVQAPTPSSVPAPAPVLAREGA